MVLWHHYKLSILYVSIKCEIIGSIARIYTRTTECFNRVFDCSIRVYQSFNSSGWVLCSARPTLHWPLTIVIYKSQEPVGSIDELIKLSLCKLLCNVHVYIVATHATQKSVYVLNLGTMNEPYPQLCHNMKMTALMVGLYWAQWYLSLCYLKMVRYGHIKTKEIFW